MLDSKNYSVYMHVFPNNKKYIGITQQSLSRRWQNGLGYQSNTLMYKAIKKYGWENIQHISLATGLTLDEANEQERLLIEQYRTTDSKFGYNIRDGGLVAAGWHHSQESIDKMRKTQIERARNFPPPDTTGCHFPRLTIYQYTLSGNLVATYKGLYEASSKTGVPIATISCLINNTQKRTGDYTFSKCELTPEEVKLKVRHKPSRQLRPVYQYDKTGNLLNVYNSLNEAASNLNIRKDSIQNCCKNHTKTYKTFIFSYKQLTKEEVSNRKIKRRSNCED